jgi:hypothetical protein
VRFGVVESLNTTIKGVIRRARGMRDETMLLLKLKWATARRIRSARDVVKFRFFELCCGAFKSRKIGNYAGGIERGERDIGIISPGSAPISQRSLKGVRTHRREQIASAASDVVEIQQALMMMARSRRLHSSSCSAVRSSPPTHSAPASVDVSPTMTARKSMSQLRAHPFAHPY